jgi:hypothetical protein
MTLLPEVNTLTFLQHKYHLLPNLWKAPYTISASTSVDVQQWPPGSTNDLLSCVLLCLSQWFFQLQKIWYSHGLRRILQYLPSPAAKEILDSISSMSLWIAMKDDGYWTPDILTRYKSDYLQTNKKTNSVALSPRANSTDWSTATCRWNLVSTFVDRGVSRGQRGGSPTVVNLSCLDRSRYFSFK